jgi:hypothetical protein
MRNTLTGSDYGLLDEETFNPRPDFWAALLWHRLMGRIVLEPDVPSQPDLHVYAHSLGAGHFINAAWVGRGPDYRAPGY